MASSVLTISVLQLDFYKMSTDEAASEIKAIDQESDVTKMKKFVETIKWELYNKAGKVSVHKGNLNPDCLIYIEHYYPPVHEKKSITA
jgi:cob(I)alamin adenosyltransferase